jgi:hypothetical protein
MDRSSAIARILSSRASIRRRSRRRDQAGFVLLLVLGVVFFFSLVGLFILNETTLSSNVVTNLASSTASTHEYDGALESAVNWYRQDGVPGADCGSEAASVSDPQMPAGYSFTCHNPIPPDTTFRVLDIEAMKGGFEVGRARVRFTDVANGLDLPGYTVEVCDWQLGEQLTTDLNQCVTSP